MKAISEIQIWCEVNAVPLVRAVRHERRWYVVFSDRRRDATGIGSTLEEAFVQAALEYQRVMGAGA